MLYSIYDLWLLVCTADMPRVDPPDFLDSGSYSLTDFSGLSRQIIAWTLGAALVVVIFGFGQALGQNAESRLGNMLGFETGNSGPSLEVTG